jgi:hypothetical protein
MLDEARYQTLKERMQAVKGLYLSRHYTQCAKHGEQLLGQVKSAVSSRALQLVCTRTDTDETRSTPSTWLISTSIRHCHTTLSLGKLRSRTVIMSLASQKSTTWPPSPHSQPPDPWTTTTPSPPQHPAPLMKKPYGDCAARLTLVLPTLQRLVPHHTRPCMTTQTQ